MGWVCVELDSINPHGLDWKSCAYTVCADCKHRYEVSVRMTGIMFVISRLYIRVCQEECEEAALSGLSGVAHTVHVHPKPVKFVKPMTTAEVYGLWAMDDNSMFTNMSPPSRLKKLRGEI